jgi:hypothetical protein
VTQQYVLGELSVLVGRLCPDGRCSLAPRVADLRHRVEQASLCGLGPLVAEAMEIAEAACWQLLEQADIDGFEREAAVTAALHEFAVCAGLLP